MLLPRCSSRARFTHSVNMENHEALTLRANICSRHPLCGSAYAFVYKYLLSRRNQELTLSQQFFNLYITLRCDNHIQLPLFIHINCILVTVAVIFNNTSIIEISFSDKQIFFIPSYLRCPIATIGL